MKHTTSHAPNDLPTDFNELNAMHQLRPIVDSVDLENATEIVDRLAVLDTRTADQESFLESLLILVERYEAEHDEEIDTSDVTGLDALKHLMDANDMKQADLAALLGIVPSAVSMILSGERQLTADHARVLGKRFSVQPGLFIL